MRSEVKEPSRPTSPAVADDTDRPLHAASRPPPPQRARMSDMESKSTAAMWAGRHAFNSVIHTTRDAQKWLSGQARLRERNDAVKTQEWTTSPLRKSTCFTVL